MAGKKKPSLQSIQRKFNKAPVFSPTLTQEDIEFLNRQIRNYNWLKDWVVPSLIIMLLVAAFTIINQRKEKEYYFDAWRGAIYYERYGQKAESQECARLRLLEILREEFHELSAIRVEPVQANTQRPTQ